MGRYDKLNGPRPLVLHAVNQLLRNFGQLANEDFLHLGMQMRFGFLDEDQVHARLGSLCAKRLVETSQLQQDEAQVASAEAVV
jgi:hypothetical protein